MLNKDTMQNKEHLIIYYKGDISALVLFCQQQDGSICFPPLPKLSATLPEDEVKAEHINLHPTALMKQINEQLQLDDDLLVAEPGFFQQVETPDGIATVYMAKFKLLDPPHQLKRERHCTMKNLTELIGGSPPEMELLRRAYVQVMED